MKVFKAPERSVEMFSKPTIFLAGSIEMGKARDWQKELTEALSILDVNILNPRRDDWDSSWIQSIDNEKFNEQVTWELDMLDKSTVIALYFDPNTKSPISLLELGLYADTGKLVVCCPNGFWRKGNVDIVCARKNIQMVSSIEGLMFHVARLVTEKS